MGRFREALGGRNFMIDGETWATGKRGVFVQLACVEFDPSKPLGPNAALRGWSRHIDVRSSLRGGRELDADTVLWWMDDSGAGPEARQALVAAMRSRDNPPVQWREALEELSTFMRGPAGRGLGHRPEPIAGVWSHGSAFDVAMVEEGYAQLGLECPWDFRQERDTRTLFQLVDCGLSQLAPPTGTKHDALADCGQQVAAVDAALNIMEGS